jgi:hypothetical protein
LILKGAEKPAFKKTALAYLKEEHFFNDLCRRVYGHFVKNEALDLLNCVIDLGDERVQLLIDEIMQKKVHLERADSFFIETVQKLCDRLWLKQSDEIKVALQEKNRSEEDLLILTKNFDALKKMRPSVSLVV